MAVEHVRKRRPAPAEPPADLIAPAAEAARLAELEAYRVLDTPPEAGFDRITALAARLFDAPIALISLVDHSRQWFKSRVGFEAEETPRDWSFCAHAVAADPPRPLVVPDTLEDARFSRSPLVLGPPHVRFYAGAPLLSPGGHALGTLCVMDDKPRPALDDDEGALLTDLAGIAADQLRLKRADAERGLLMRELSHRMKNLLSVVQSVAELSARNHPGARDYLAGFRERLQALAAAHDNLMSGHRHSAGLKRLVETVIGGRDGSLAGRVEIALPNAAVDPDTAQTLALVVHELMTNAMKYGALSNGEGRVAIRGRRARKNGRAVVQMDWREEGGPPVEPPERQGFGLVMMEVAAHQKGGGAKFDWRPEGFACRIVIPLA